MSNASKVSLYQKRDKNQDNFFARGEEDCSEEKPKPALLNINAKKGQPKPKILSKSLEDYYDDRMTEKAVDHEPGFANVSYTQATEQEAARKEIACLDNVLVKAREVWREEKKGLDARWTTCTERYESIFASIPALNDFYKDSFIKRDRAHQVLLQEQADIRIRDRHISRLKKEVAALTEIRDSQKKRSEKFSIFKDYLLKVQETSRGEYGELRDIVERYNTLLEAKTVLGERNEEIRDYVSNKQKTHEEDVHIKCNEIMLYRNYLSELLEYKDAIQEEAQRLEDSLFRIKTTAAQRTKIIGQIRMSIDNLYKHVCKYMHRPPRINPDDTIGQLNDVGISVGEMFKLSKDIKRMLKTAFATAEAEREFFEQVRKKEEEKRRRMEKFKKGGGGGDNFHNLFDLPPLHEVQPGGKVNDLLNHGSA